MTAGLGPPAADSPTPFEVVTDPAESVVMSGYMQFVEDASVTRPTIVQVISPGQAIYIGGPITLESNYLAGFVHGGDFYTPFRASSAQRVSIAARMSFTNWSAGLDANQFTGLLMTAPPTGELFSRTDVTTKRWGVGLVRGSDNWHSFACDGGTFLATDLGIPAVAGQLYILTVILTSQPGNTGAVVVGINGTEFSVSTLTNPMAECCAYCWGRGDSTSGDAETVYFAGAWETETEGTI